LTPGETPTYLPCACEVFHKPGRLRRGPLRFRLEPLTSLNQPPRRSSDSTVRRLSLYLRTLEGLRASGASTVSSGDLAERAGTGAAQVRKDLSTFGAFGTRGLGYPVEALHSRIREILGLDRAWRVALVGAGRIGSALHAYPHFRERGFQIVAVLDDDPAKVGQHWDATPIRPASELETLVAREGVEIVILAVPAAAAQPLADRAAAAGVRGILNFAPVRLRVAPGVEVNNVNLAVELEALSHAMAGRRRGEGGAPSGSLHPA
jgi:redox-sensing transcriptional repressor